MTKHFSFEFFPPKTEKGIENLRGVYTELATLKPEFFSVTYGAGGSTQNSTLNTVIEIQENSGVEAAPHLSCIGSTEESISDILDLYKSKGVKRIVALRGDLPSGTREIGHFEYANELVSFIKQHSGDYFHLEVAAYPEMHPQAPSYQDDVINFARKVNAGADSAITQYFYNPDAYFYFLDACEKEHINVPIVPGIMPITNFTQLARFSDATGAEIPRWLRMKLEGYGDDLQSIQALGTEYVTRMCETLLANDIPGLHFYCMNKVEPSLSIWNNLELTQQ